MEVVDTKNEMKVETSSHGKTSRIEQQKSHEQNKNGKPYSCRRENFGKDKTNERLNGAKNTLTVNNLEEV